jgi:hypothetical protein
MHRSRDLVRDSIEDSLREFRNDSDSKLLVPDPKLLISKAKAGI